MTYSPLLKKYYRLAKPGIIYGNVMTTIGGFLFAASRHFYPGLLVSAVAGTALIIASACVVNNYIDRDIDAKMTRTRKRSLVNGEISARAALLYAAVLGTTGAAILAAFTNTTTLVLGVIGWVSYVAVYTPSKRRTVHSTLIGSVSGATPIAAGYTAVTGRFDAAALILFVIMVIWQLPHFYAIAMFRVEEYRNASIPVLAVQQGTVVSKQYILAYSSLFLLAVVALSVFGGAGYAFLTVMTGASLYWIWLGFTGLRTKLDDVKWARGMFGTSLIVLLALSGMLALDPWLV